ncbi:ABC transporter ATP-binding protein [Aquipuribacter hungaricus]|uniref:ABC transporter ATP-binding protein n=1 Tax=Aquipuribacter hungaricus TaxID=545624 RepID=A0ABV7WCF3_9MICO
MASAAPTAATTGAASGRIATASGAGGWATVRRGLSLSPEILQGIWVTLLLAAVSTVGRVIVPVGVQQTIDTGINAPGGPDVGRIVTLVLLAAGAVLLTGLCAYLVNVRLFTATEAGLATLRTTAFRRIHDLSTLTQNTERRGALVSRVTSDVDTISTFVQFGGLILFISLGQIVVATVLMAVYSWWLALLVWVAFLPLFLSLRPLQKLLSVRFAAVRENVGLMLGGISEAVVGADTIRAYGAERRTQGRIDAGVEEHRRTATSAGVFASSIFASGTLVSGLAVAAVVGVGVWAGVGGALTIGELLAFLFLVQLFTQPVQIATEMLNELQNALAGWRRVIAVLDTPADIADPAGSPGATPVPPGPVTARFEGVTYAYPDGPQVLKDIDLEIPAQARVAVVGETGSGKTTLAKLLTRLQDPATGRVLLNGVDLRDVPFSSLRRRVVLVPQEGFLFDVSLRENIRLARPGATDEAVDLVVTEMGLQPWLEGLPHGLDTRVGQRGESLSAGERQLVAVARAYLADPDLLVLDEATSAVDPATEVRLNRALDGLTRGRTSVAIAHRLSTAEAADLVVVVDAGRVVETGTSVELVRAGGVYARLHASWVAQRSDDSAPVDPAGPSTGSTAFGTRGAADDVEVDA